ncbi:MAG: glycosyltransferase [Ktedonobacteraceae bacterium]|nr:glycosyltransferase [Ktedonobacteraceae bacterium]
MSYAIAMLSVHTSPLDAPGRTRTAGGMNVYIRELALALARQNITVDIFTRRTNEHIPQIVSLSPRVRVIHIGTGLAAPIDKNDLYQHLPTFIHNIEAFRKKEGLRYDVLHSHYWLSGVAAHHLARIWDVPHVTMFHTLARLKELASQDTGTEPALRLEMEQRLLQQADRIIAATDDERTQMMRHCGATAQRVTVIPCGVDLTLFQPHSKQAARTQLGLDPQRSVLLFAGRLDPFKGPDLLLRAAALMQEDAQVLIVGGKLSGDKDVRALRQLASELRIRERVSFLGARPQQEMPQFYSAADVTVIPSYHETFGLAAVESLACGTPVVATRAGGLTTVVRHGETGFLVPRCPGFFAERLDTLLRDNELLASMQGASRASVAQFSWEHVAARVRELYEEVSSDMSCLAAQ